MEACWLAVCDLYSENSTTLVDGNQVETAIEGMLFAFERKDNTAAVLKHLPQPLKMWLHF